MPGASVAVSMLQALCTLLLTLAFWVLEENQQVKDALVPVGCILAATMAAWEVIPLLLKSYYNESISFNEVRTWVTFPYEASYWGALEDPLRFLICYFAFSLGGYVIAPLIVWKYVLPVWKGVGMASIVWFLHNWKRGAFTQVLTVMEITEVDRESITNLDRLFSNAIFGLGLLALAAAVGVYMQYIILIICVGDWVFFLPAKNIMRDVYAGYDLLTSQSMAVRVGDIVKTRSGKKGQVVEIGLTATLLLVEKKLPVLLPNSEVLFPALVKSNAYRYLAMVAKIQLRTADLSKIHLISKDMKSMLLMKSKVIWREPSFCFLSWIEKPNAELVLGCSLEYMSVEELVSTEQDIIRESRKITALHDATNKGMTIRFFKSQH